MHYMDRQSQKRSGNPEKTKLEKKIDLIIKERRMRRLGHLLRMDDDRLSRQAVLGVGHNKEETWKIKENLEQN